MEVKSRQSWQLLIGVPVVKPTHIANFGNDYAFFGLLDSVVCISTHTMAFWILDRESHDECINFGVYNKHELTMYNTRMNEIITKNATHFIHQSKITPYMIKHFAYSSFMKSTTPFSIYHGNVYFFVRNRFHVITLQGDRNTHTTYPLIIPGFDYTIPFTVKLRHHCYLVTQPATNQIWTGWVGDGEANFISIRGMGQLVSVDFMADSQYYIIVKHNDQYKINATWAFRSESKWHVIDPELIHGVHAYNGDVFVCAIERELLMSRLKRQASN